MSISFLETVPKDDANIEKASSPKLSDLSQKSELEKSLDNDKTSNDEKNAESEPIQSSIENNENNSMCQTSVDTVDTIKSIYIEPKKISKLSKQYFMKDSAEIEIKKSMLNKLITCFKLLNHCIEYNESLLKAISLSDDINKSKKKHKAVSQALTHFNSVLDRIKEYKTNMNSLIKTIESLKTTMEMTDIFYKVTEFEKKTRIFEAMNEIFKHFSSIVTLINSNKTISKAVIDKYVPHLFKNNLNNFVLNIQFVPEGIPVEYSNDDLINLPDVSDFYDIFMYPFYVLRYPIKEWFELGTHSGKLVLQNTSFVDKLKELVAYFDAYNQEYQDLSLQGSVECRFLKKYSDTSSPEKDKKKHRISLTLQKSPTLTESSIEKFKFVIMAMFKVEDSPETEGLYRLSALSDKKYQNFLKLMNGNYFGPELFEGYSSVEICNYICNVISTMQIIPDSIMSKLKQYKPKIEKAENDWSLDPEEKEILLSLLSNMKPNDLIMLIYFLKHLFYIATFERHNKMGIGKLANSIGPSLFPPQDIDMDFSERCNRFFTKMILVLGSGSFDMIFEEVIQKNLIKTIKYFEN
ncbi:MAG: hypothetical protein MHPSP_001277 [Paramarteilia canceri]